MKLNRRRFLLSTAAMAAVHAADSRYKVGITSNTIGGWERDPFVGFREARDVGYRYVESFVHYFPNFYPDKPSELKAKLDEIGVNLITMSNGGKPTDMHFEDPSHHERAIADHLQLVRFIKTFGCDHLKIYKKGQTRQIWWFVARARSVIHPTATPGRVVFAAR